MVFRVSFPHVNVFVTSILFCISGMCSVSAGQVTGNESKEHCDYIEEQATAEEEVLKAPLLESGFTQPENGLPPQFVIGAAEKLQNLRKASTTAEVARTGCDLYAASMEASRKIYFFFPAIEKDILQQRLGLIDKSVEELKGLIAADQMKIDSHDMTKPSVYPLQAALVRLVSDRTSILTGIVAPYVPPQNSAALKELVASKRAADSRNQEALVRLEKQNNWDIAVSAGLHHQLGSGSSEAVGSPNGAYATVSVSYNFASVKAGRHLDRSVAAYDRWQSKEFNDVAAQAEILERQVKQTIDIQRTQLDSLRSQQDVIENNLRAIENVDTAAAASFRNQLLADRVILKVDIADVSYRIQLLRKELADNF